MATPLVASHLQYPLDIALPWSHNKLTMQMRFNKDAPARPRNLTALKKGESGILERIDLSEDAAQRLMELGFLPGHSVTRAHSAPGGDPRVFRVDGSEVALRRETAVHLILR
jgi:ferrous iron transport protein A